MAGPRKASGAPAAKAAEVARPEGAPRFVRLTGIAAHAGGKVLPIGKSLEVGIEIPVALAEARVAAETAEWVKDTAITAQALRDAISDVAARGRHALDSLVARVEAATDADLIELAESGAAFGDEDRSAAEAVSDAIAAHRAALETEANLTPPEDAQAS